MLNAKQEQFVQNLFRGESQREAYKHAYNAKYKDEAIDTKASLLFATDKVQKRYKELIDATAKDTIISVQKRKELLTRIALAAEYETYSSNDGEMYTTPPRIDTRMKAVDTLNKMDGIYVQKIAGDINANIKLEDYLNKVVDTNEY